MGVNTDYRSSSALDSRTKIGALINSDPKNHHSDIGERIFGHLIDDLPSAIAFTRVSKGLYARSKHKWFVKHSGQIIFKYIQQGTGYKDYLKNGGWQDLVIATFKVAGIATTIGMGVKTSIHNSRIPKDAPKKTKTYYDEDGKPYNITYIDHPEARKAEICCFITTAVGVVTIGALAHGIFALLKDMDLDVFFSKQKNMLGNVTNIGLKLISPSFLAWKAAKMKENLVSNPKDWQKHPELKKMICPISGDFMFFPVKDTCGHYLDFRSVRAYQLNNSTPDPLECPVSKKKPNKGLRELHFDKARFDFIQSAIYELNHPNA